MGKPNLGKLVASKLKPKKVDPRTDADFKAVTRFAPSPTGFIHLCSLRTALYNYLLAKSTGGKFILRLEDTDQTRLKPGAEQNIYESLKWTNIFWDEGPVKQSERKTKYAEHAEQLLASGSAYRCFCSKERLDRLTHSARQLWPPSTASYDRKCSHISREESDQRAADGDSFVLRFRSPHVWPKFHDVLHGDVEIHTQINEADRRYDDFVLLKSDKMPTYHFANVVDDKDMKITHVVRGEEWLPSTPKHIALYHALGTGTAQIPEFVHIPLLTSEGGKKLSKRKGDQGIFDFARGPDYILPEALVNFAALLGWSPLSGGNHYEHGESLSDVLSMKDLESRFTLQGLTKGNVQVDYSKLAFLNKQHFRRMLKTNFSELAQRCRAALDFDISAQDAEHDLHILENHVSSIGDFVNYMKTVRAEPEYTSNVMDRATRGNSVVIVKHAIDLAEKSDKKWDPQDFMAQLSSEFSKKDANMSLRYALLDGKPGVSIVETLALLKKERSLARLNAFISKASHYCT